MSHSPTQSVTTLTRSDALEVHLLGLVEYEAAQFLQERLIYEISGRSDKMGGLLLCEHPPMITMGREASRSQILVDEQDLRARQIELKWVNRGGGTIMHAPGQLAVYPILPLNRLEIGLEEYRHQLQEATIAMCREMKIKANRADNLSEGANDPGIFCHSGQLGTIGAAVKSWTSFHGLFLNVCPDMELVRWAQMNTMGVRLTSMAAQQVRPVSMHKVRESMIRHVAETFDYSRYHVYTGHPLLVRKKKQIYVDA
ncbi:Octanoyltransferase [Polystyrenella longa]|uniref:Octanoyltransferase n=1 Tax=Polystyrenella longa TaxID=2528007 RepID=A0A518CM41_9PLAN|nr:lipoyl(octanoyl) transferase LipB [Polystyrenella longa]QDU80299.1 Octanoyltransferase [Polystyrenella longa]